MLGDFFTTQLFSGNIIFCNKKNCLYFSCVEKNGRNFFLLSLDYDKIHYLDFIVCPHLSLFFLFSITIKKSFFFSGLVSGDVEVLFSKNKCRVWKIKKKY